MTRLLALAHRAVKGHWPEPWQIFVWDDNDPPAAGCRACLKAAVMRDIAADAERAQHWPRKGF